MNTIHKSLRRLYLYAAALAVGGVCADVVHVYEETKINGVMTRIGETTRDTGRTYLTQTAPAKSGYIFTHWSISTRQAFAERDAWGRAHDAAPFTLYEDTTLTAHYLPASTDADGDGVPDGRELYWYGNLEQDGAGDTDGDGRTFAEELAAGTNPLMAERRVEGPVRWADSETLEANLQPFDQARGAVVDGRFVPLFTSTFADEDAAGMTFGANARPVVADVDGDGLFDLVVLHDGGHAVYRNVGSDGNPCFTRADGLSTNGLDLAAGSLAALDGIALDVPPSDAVSCAFGDVDQDGIVDLLVGDAEGRIWFYKGVPDGSYVLRHKVWGGTHAGFASGLSIALVDWDGDGDLDCLVGTADGRLMLLVDPAVGRPSNVTAMAGVDSVVLSWDPSGNSKVRGYGVYRGVDSNAFTRVESLWPLPRYRDVPGIVRDYWYRVTGMSRFYTAGNSTPIVSESMPTDAVHVQFRPHVWLTDTSGFTGSNVTVVVSMNNSMGVAAGGLSMDFTFDPAVLEPVAIRPTGLTDALDYTADVADGTWRLAATGGEIGTGAGRFLLLDFRVKDVHDVTATTVTLASATVKALDGRAVALDLPQSATIEISDSNPLVPALVAVSLADARVDGGTSFTLPVAVTATEALTSFTADVAFDPALLRFDGWTGSAAAGDLALKFHAPDPRSTETNLATAVALANAVATDCNGFTVRPAGASCTVFIRNVNPIVAARVSVSTADVRVDTCEEVAVTFRVTSDHALRSGRFTVVYDTDALERADADGTVVVDAAGDFSLAFTARDQHALTSTQVRLVAAEVVDCHGFTVHPSVPVVATVLIHDAHPLLPPRVSLSLGGAAAATEGEFTMTLGVVSTEPLASLKMDVSYDASLLELRGGSLEYDGGVPDSVALVFYAKENHDAASTVVTVSPRSGAGRNGLAAEFSGPASGTVVFTDSNPLVPATVSVSLGGARAETLSEFSVPVALTGAGTLTNFAATVEWDDAVLSYLGENPVRLPGAVPERFALRFYARDQHAVTSTRVRLTGASAVDSRGLAANPIADAEGTVLIHDSNPLLPAEVALRVEETRAETRTEFAVPVRVTATRGLTNLSVAVGWDASVLDCRGADAGTLSGGRLSVGGAVPEVVNVRFHAKDQHAVHETEIALADAAAWCVEGLRANVAAAGGRVYLTDSNPSVAPTMSVGAWSVKTKGGETFRLPVGRTSDGEIADLTVRLAWDAALLYFGGAEGASSSAGLTASGGTFTFAAEGLRGTNFLAFTAREIRDLRTNAWVRVLGASGTGANGLAARVRTEFPLEASVLILREIGRYSPGDVDGDGRLTQGDMTRLQDFIKYQSIVGALPELAGRPPYASWKLTGDALRAADANGDGIVDVNDVSLLAQWLLQIEEVAE